MLRKTPSMTWLQLAPCWRFSEFISREVLSPSPSSHSVAQNPRLLIIFLFPGLSSVSLVLSGIATVPGCDLKPGGQKRSLGGA